MKDIFFGFDLDETLIHSKKIGVSEQPYDDADFNIYNGNQVSYSVYIRPHAKLLLDYIKERYHLFFYTRAGSSYAEQIVDNLGCNNYPTFSSSSIEREKVETLEEGIKKFLVKRLDKIASKLGASVDNMIFVDDIRNTREIRPISQVLQVPEYDGSDLDSVLYKLYSRLKEIDNKSDKELIKDFLSQPLDELINIANPINKYLHDEIKQKIEKKFKPN